MSKHSSTCICDECFIKRSVNQSYQNVEGCGKEFKLNITHPTKHRCGNLLFCDTCLYNKGSDKKDYQNVENHNPKDLLSSDLNNHSLKAKSFGVKDKGSEEKE